jgi:hypothetical protein
MMDDKTSKTMMLLLLMMTMMTMMKAVLITRRMSVPTARCCGGLFRREIDELRGGAGREMTQNPCIIVNIDEIFR